MPPYDLRDATPLGLIGDALKLLADGEDRVIRVIGAPVQSGGQLIEITLKTQAMRVAT